MVRPFAERSRSSASPENILNECNGFALKPTNCVGQADPRTRKSINTAHSEWDRSIDPWATALSSPNPKSDDPDPPLLELKNP
jgi:hypothetical protein